MTPDAVARRRRPEIHKRLMLVASMVLVGPALGRYIAYRNIWKSESSVPQLATVLDHTGWLQARAGEHLPTGCDQYLICNQGRRDSNRLIGTGLRR
jgi:hypothetical protein